MKYYIIHFRSINNQCCMKANISFCCTLKRTRVFLKTLHPKKFFFVFLCLHLCTIYIIELLFYFQEMYYNTSYYTSLSHVAIFGCIYVPYTLWSCFSFAKKIYYITSYYFIFTITQIWHKINKNMQNQTQYKDKSNKALEKEKTNTGNQQSELSIEKIL